ncbi:hypothetical protein [Corynebacterium sp. UBA2622]|uniref:hypothetical protein n=1 Tax=Corynebacterium sp. UBA2622 TaxID=1946393 RepID=UPI0025B9BEC2|nr:hypothetical protein [Corynebacterium sp. UBA2622]
MKLFGGRKPSDATAPATSDRAIKVLKERDYEAETNEHDVITVPFNGGMCVVRTNPDYLEIGARIAGEQMEGAKRSEVLDWAENFNRNNFVPTLFVAGDGEGNGLGLLAVYRIPTAWEYTDEQFEEQLFRGLDAVSQVLRGYLAGYEV